MAKVFHVDDPAKVPALVRERMLRAHTAAAFAASERTKRLVSKDSPVDQGEYKLGWHTRAEIADKRAPVVVLANDAPHAGVIEQGARPHKVPIAPLLKWAQRKAGDLMLAGIIRPTPTLFRTDKKGFLKYRGPSALSRDAEASAEVEAFAWAVRNKIAKVGQKPRWIMRKRLPEAAAFLREAYERELRRAAKTPAKPGGGVG